MKCDHWNIHSFSSHYNFSGDLGKTCCSKQPSPLCNGSITEVHSSL